MAEDNTNNKTKDVSKKFIQDNFLSIDVENYNGGIVYNSIDIGDSASGCNASNVIYNKSNKIYSYDFDETKKTDGNIPYYINTKANNFNGKNIYKIGAINVGEYRNSICIGDETTTITNTEKKTVTTSPIINGNVNKDKPYDGSESFKYNVGNWERASVHYDDTDLIENRGESTALGSIYSDKGADGTITWHRVIAGEDGLNTTEKISITGDVYNTSNTLKASMDKFEVAVKPMAARNV